MGTSIGGRLAAAALGLTAAIGLSTLSAAADAPIEITWSDLTPPLTPEQQKEADRAAAALAEMTGGVVQPGDFSQGPGPGMVYHGTVLDMGGDGTELVSAYDDKQVSMPGYMYPIEADENGVSRFLLVPFVGACLHVPPPPPNQIVLVDLTTPYPAKTMFEAVTVIGQFSRTLDEIEDTGVGYHIQAETVTKFNLEQP